MAVSLGLFVSMLVNQVLCGLALLFLTCVALNRLISENEQARKPILPRIPVTMHRLRTLSNADPSIGKANSPAANSGGIQSSEKKISDLSHTPGSEISGDSDKTVKHSSGTVSRTASPRSGNNVSSPRKPSKNNSFILMFSVKSVIVCGSFLMTNLLGLLSMVGVISCTTRGMSAPLLFQIAKGTTLTVFVDRVGQVYRHSVYEYSKFTLNMLYAVVILSTLTYSVLWIALMGHVSTSVQGFPNGQVCGIDDNTTIVPILSQFTEFCIEVSTLRMFTSPLRKLCKMGDEMDSHILGMATLARKTTVLTYVMFATMLIGIMIMVASNNYMAGQPATVIYCVTLLLFPHWFDEWYPTLCSIPIWMSDQCCSLPKKVSTKKVMRHISGTRFTFTDSS